MNENNIVSLLKSGTSSAHENLHGNPLLKYLNSQDINLEIYKEIIEGFYKLYLFFDYCLKQEDIYCNFVALSLKKLSFDASKLGIKIQVKDLSSILENKESLEMKSYDDYLSLRYIMQGSKMGSMIISKNIARHLKLDEFTGLSFFTNEQEKTLKDWYQFLHHLEIKHQDIEKVIKRANEIFQIIDNHFKEKAKNLSHES